MATESPIFYEVFAKDGDLTKEEAPDYATAKNRLMKRFNEAGVEPVAIFDEEKNTLYVSTGIDRTGFSLNSIREVCGLPPHHVFAEEYRLPYGSEYA